MKKMSNKQKKQYYSQFRGNWNGVNPVTKIVPSGKRYKRQSFKKLLGSDVIISA